MSARLRPSLLITAGTIGEAVCVSEHRHDFYQPQGKHVTIRRLAT
ncbi:MAG: hypothetical protein N2689_09680 [Verrucomicrobiae bacterium]|nr:hypothetical protein [Verrucomicrobiae bacterium]